MCAGAALAWRRMGAAAERAALPPTLCPSPPPPPAPARSQAAPPGGPCPCVPPPSPRARAAPPPAPCARAAPPPASEARERQRVEGAGGRARHCLPFVPASAIYHCRPSKQPIAAHSSPPPGTSVHPRARSDRCATGGWCGSHRTRCPPLAQSAGGRQVWQGGGVLHAALWALSGRLPTPARLPPLCAPPTCGWKDVMMNCEGSRSRLACRAIMAATVVLQL